MTSRAVLGIAMLALASCDGIAEMVRKDDRCGPQLRTSTVRGSVGPVNNPHAMVQVQLIEAGDDSTPTRIRLDLTAWNAPRSVLEGHVRQAMLLDSGGHVLLEFPLGVGPGDHVITNRPVVLTEPARTEAIRAQLVQHGARIRIITDLPQAPALEERLAYGESTGWQRAICPKWRGDV